MTYLELAAGLKPRYGQKLMIAEIVKGLLDTEQATHRSVWWRRVPVPEKQSPTCSLYCLWQSTWVRSWCLSTATVALQEQIVLKDLPELREHSGLSFDYALAKGRGRYLCLSKLDQWLVQRCPESRPWRSMRMSWRYDYHSETLELYQELADRYTSKGSWDGERDSWPEEIAPMTPGAG